MLSTRQYYCFLNTKNSGCICANGPLAVQLADTDAAQTATFFSNSKSIAMSHILPKPRRFRDSDGAGTMWLVLGGGLYTLGCVFYLWRSLPYAHMVWHLFVLAGTICHFFCILWHVMA